MPHQSTRPATAEEIQHMVGDVDDVIINNIMRTETSSAGVTAWRMNQGVMLSLNAGF